MSSRYYLPEDTRDPIDLLDILLSNAEYISNKIINGSDKYTVKIHITNENCKVYSKYNRELRTFAKFNARASIEVLEGSQSLAKHKAKKLVIRHLESLSKFCEQIIIFSEHIFQDECLEELLSSYLFEVPDFSQVKQKAKEFEELPLSSSNMEVLENDKDNYLTRIDYSDSKLHILEGFIMEGKTEFLDKNDLFDSEISKFYRASLKPNKFNLENVPNKYFKLFALAGIYGSFCKFFDTNTLVIDRSWISHNWFADKSKEQTFLSRHLYWHFSFWATILTDKLSDNEFFLTMYMWYKVCPQVPWPIYDHRKMEQGLYEDKDDLELNYVNFYAKLNSYLANFSFNKNF